jgi:hypothetical protein
MLPALSPNGISASLPPAAGTPLYSLDKIGDVVEPFAKQPVHVQSDGEIQLSGFAVDKVAKDLAGGVDIAIDGLAFSAHYGISRPDVAAYFKIATYGQAGFSFSIPARYFGRGRHKLAVRVVSKDKTRYYEGPVLEVNIM